MKTILTFLFILAVFIEPVAAEPAVPFLALSGAVDKMSLNAGPTFPNLAPQQLQALFTTNNGTRFRFGYNFHRGNLPRYENSLITTGVDKQVAENWWVSAGYQRGESRFSSFNAGVAYSLSPNAALSIGYILETKYDLKNSIFQTHLYISF